MTSDASLNTGKKLLPHWVANAKLNKNTMIVPQGFGNFNNPVQNCLVSLLEPPLNPVPFSMFVEQSFVLQQIGTQYECDGNGHNQVRSISR